MSKNKLSLILAILLIVTCLCCLVACGDNPDNPKDSVKPFTVKFVTNGGSEIADVNCTEKDSFKNILGDRVTVKDGKKFVGWFTDEGLQNEASMNVVISADKTFYAKWRDYTNAELLEKAVLFAYENAIAVKDDGYVRTGNSTSDAHSVHSVVTLENGKVTSGFNSTRYYSDGMLYGGTIGKDSIKLKPNDATEVMAYLYHNRIFKSLGFFDVFAPLVMGLAADADGCVMNVTDDGFQVKYVPKADAVRFTLVKYGTPWVYFSCGKTFDFKVVDGKVTEAKHSGGSYTRTIQFFYEDDELPVVEEPEDKTAYTQKWQVNVAIDGRGTEIKYYENLNKATLDKDCFGDDYKPQTSKLTYYYDEDKTQPIDFSGGDVVLDKHITIYHAGIDYSNLTVAGYDFTTSNAYYTMGEVISPEGIKTTTLMMKEVMNGVNSLSFSLMPCPYNAKNPTPIITFDSTPEGDDSLFENKITVKPSSGGTYFEVKIIFPISGTYTLKIVSDDGFVCQYVRILPKP